MMFLDPWFLLLLLFLPISVFLVRRNRPGPTVSYSSNHAFAGLPETFRARLFVAPRVLRLLAFACLVVGLASPVSGRESVSNTTRGIAIEMVIDRSGSMSSTMSFEGKKESRLAVVKQVFHTFVDGNGRALAGRPNDLIGIVTFARYADTICPLTLDHRTLLSFLKQIHLPVRPSLDGTAIGDGIALAAAHLKMIGREIGKAGGRRYHVRSKVIILLTDGQNNFGRLTPMAAAALAKRWGIRIYTIGIGSTGGPVTVNTLFGPQTISAPSGVNASMLRKIAQTTGGIYQAAANGSRLVDVYHKIDSLQKSALPTSKFVDWREVFLPFLLVGLGFLLIGVLLENTILRRIP